MYLNKDQINLMIKFYYVLELMNLSQYELVTFHSVYKNVDRSVTNEERIILNSMRTQYIDILNKSYSKELKYITTITK